MDINIILTSITSHLQMYAILANKTRATPFIRTKRPAPRNLNGSLDPDEIVKNKRLYIHKETYVAAESMFLCACM